MLTRAVFPARGRKGVPPLIFLNINVKWCAFKAPGNEDMMVWFKSLDEKSSL